MKYFPSLFLKVFALILVASPFLLSAQTPFPYQLSWKRQGIIAGTVVGLGLTDLVVRNRVSSFSETELLLLDPLDVPAFERGITEQYSEAAAHRSDIGWIFTTTAGIVTSASTLFGTDSYTGNNPKWKRLGTLALMWTEVNLVTGIGTDLVKSLVVRTRPFAYNPIAPLEEKLDPDARKSFFSGHTSLTTANAFFAAKIFTDIYPDSKWKPLVWGGAALVPAWVGMERVLAGKHFPSDVVAGYFFGAAIGYLIPELNKTDGFMKKHTSGMHFQLYPVSSMQMTGVGMTLTF